ncbi:hypothetical protein AVEN_120203-1, partial [Araneus ventricosus]
ELPEADAENPVGLIKVSREVFKDTQKKDPSLAECWKKGEKDNNEEFEIEREVLFRKVKDHRGVVRKQLVIPVELRLEILKLCHEA